jgi:hypothetical protein
MQPSARNPAPYFSANGNSESAGSSDITVNYEVKVDDPWGVERIEPPTLPNGLKAANLTYANGKYVAYLYNDTSYTFFMSDSITGPWTSIYYGHLSALNNSHVKYVNGKFRVILNTSVTTKPEISFTDNTDVTLRNITTTITSNLFTNAIHHNGDAIYTDPTGAELGNYLLYTAATDTYTSYAKPAIATSTVNHIISMNGYSDETGLIRSGESRYVMLTNVNNHRWSDDGITWNAFTSTTLNVGLNLPQHASMSTTSADHYINSMQTTNNYVIRYEKDFVWTGTTVGNAGVYQNDIRISTTGNGMITTGITDNLAGIRYVSNDGFYMANNLAIAPLLDTGSTAGTSSARYWVRGNNEYIITNTSSGKPWWYVVQRPIVDGQIYWRPGTTKYPRNKITKEK